ncbi:MAG: nucleotide exchange factor GrpE [Erysipelotrichaceae bacterium]|nr:nucleotide exchange factor GrpE [Erysipelotrichaceae bacterium]
MEEKNEKCEDLAKQTNETVNDEELEVEEKEVEIGEEETLDDSDAKITELEAKIEQLQNQYAKAYADTQNMQKRLQNEFEMSKKYRIQSFALDILPVIDNCERALAQDTSDEKYKKGVEMIYNQLIQALKKEGVEAIDCLNKPFDANYHQAIMMEKVEGVESGIVTEVLQKGYMLKDRILRAAMVKVSE